MKVELSGKAEAIVGVAHITDEKGRRGTKAWLVMPGGQKDYHAVAMCSSHDNFCKRTGRRLAADRLLSKLRLQHEEMTREDRQIIFSTICPEYRQKAKKRKVPKPVQCL